MLFEYSLPRVASALSAKSDVSLDSSGHDDKRRRLSGGEGVRAGMMPDGGGMMPDGGGMSESELAILHANTVLAAARQTQFLVDAAAFARLQAPAGAAVAVAVAGAAAAAAGAAGVGVGVGTGHSSTMPTAASIANTIHTQHNLSGSSL